MGDAFQGLNAGAYPTLQLTITDSEFSYGRTPYFVKWIKSDKDTSKHELALLFGKDGSTVLLTSNTIKVANPDEKLTAIVVLVNGLKTYFNEILSSEGQVEWPLEFKGTNGFVPKEDEKSLTGKTLRNFRLAYKKR